MVRRITLCCFVFFVLFRFDWQQKVGILQLPFRNKRFISKVFFGDECLVFQKSILKRQDKLGIDWY